MAKKRASKPRKTASVSKPRATDGPALGITNQQTVIPNAVSDDEPAHKADERSETSQGGANPQVQAVSNMPDSTQTNNQQGSSEQTAQPENQASNTNWENVTPVADGDGEGMAQARTRVESRSEATRRWRNEGIDETVAAFRDRVREEYRAAHPDRSRREAHDHAWTRAMAEFPPPGVEPAPPAVECGPVDLPENLVDSAPESAQDGLFGLADIPVDWPDLPPNAALAAEVQWVQSNRLRVRQGEAVDLSRALSPAPSHAALSWLETAILFPAKWADITAKATQHQEDEREHVRRERRAIEDVQGLLAEMAGD